MTETDKTGLWQELKLCLGLLTRLPTGLTGIESPEIMARASRWFPLVGLLVGGLSAAVLYGGAVLDLPNSAAALIALGASILLTGALHEDGLADTADGLGGGHDRDSRLAIMRDSHIGTYGVLALILSVGLRWSALVALMGNSVGAAMAALIVAASVSRLVPVMLMNVLSPARRDGMAVGAGSPAGPAVRLACALALGSLFFLSHWPAMVLTIIAALAVFVALGAFAVRRIGGQTGDVLGASQQGTEVLVLLCLATVGP
ncbi:MAG: adenosylcobinamide-GDP ribazoletransferase [Rhodospirillaceae bacterium]|nr:adenosylcobinamide-GDP ribazoletransferase [Rhodospirillaceae bacterium]MBT5455709.1 adenosylcobinamide-GDP ribazoletransferase [Rhodospirillaceae bacterium]